jgi:hypothetical protein
MTPSIYKLTAFTFSFVLLSEADNSLTQKILRVCIQIRKVQNCWHSDLKTTFVTKNNQFINSNNGRQMFLHLTALIPATFITTIHILTISSENNV